MAKTLKIFEDEKLVYEGILSVNTAILKGKLINAPKINGNIVHFTLQISGGKNSKTNEWYKSTYIDCSSFGELGQQIFERYSEKDDIWIVARFYSNVHDGKKYKGFNIKEVINMKAESPKDPNSTDFVGDLDIPF